MAREILLKTVELSNGETYGYRECKGGEKIIVLVHGNLASSVFFDELIEELPSEYTAYAIDMRGFGISTYNKPIDTLRDFAGDLKLFVDALRLEKFDLLGWSTGGAVSMLFCSSYGYMVDKLFLVSSAGIMGYHSYAEDNGQCELKLKSKKEIQEDVTKLKQLQALENHDKDFYEKIWTAGIYNNKKPSTEIYDKQLEDSLLQKNLMDAYYGLAEFNISDKHNGISMGTEEVYKIKNPAAVIVGDSDLLVSVETAKTLKESLGGYTELITIEECGHSPFVDALDVVIETIKTFNI